MRRIVTAAMAFAVLAATPFSVEAAGAVHVTFVNPERYRDIGDRYPRRQSGVLKEIESYFDYLGERYLKEGQVLSIEVLNIDLAGQFEPWRFEWRDVRIMRDITPPSFKLRYALVDRGNLLMSAEERVTDMTYLWGAGSIYGDQRLGYEKKMLRNWFRSRFVRLNPPRG
jgi:Protein of unknown function (DUF3016)